MTADQTYQPKVYHAQDGDIIVIASGGELRIEAGGIVTDDGVQAATVAAFGGDTGGTADGDMADVSTAVTGVDGSGNNAASKADVDTRLGAIADNFQECEAKIDAITAALRGAGILAAS